ncbi:FimV/HubP family polar landmark protein [Thiosocius teredinicola]|uniref:FimV/HubP family polar landmark protein n=1 Tax=Thiosocius teredinicola TaxID=1973002 RepID=UPI000990D44E
MVRKLALAVSLALGTLSVPVHALGLGELSSKSTLNQNFNGDISLLSVNPEELDGVRVRLADEDAFARAGIERPFYLTLLRFEPTMTKRGKAVVKVTSDFPIREPFLNFLVEVNWPKGRLMREYTVLLDPPTTTKRRPPAIAQTTKSKAAAPAPKPAAKPAKPSAAATTSQAPTPSPASTEGFEYGPVQENDTVWGIARKTLPAGVSMEQMMMALYKANPQAFVRNDINLLRKGRILRVPSVAEIKEMSRQEARDAYREQQDQWLARRNEKLQEAAAEEQAEADAKEAATEEGADAKAAAAESESDASDQLRIATARPQGEGEAGAGDDDATATTSDELSARLLAARENAETSRQEAESLRGQVDDLKDRLSDMQKLLSLKDEQLAQLQDQITTGDGAAPATEETPATEAMAEGEAAPGEETAAEAGDALDAVMADAKDAVEGVADTVADGMPSEVKIEDIAPQVDPDTIVESTSDEAPAEAPVASEVDLSAPIQDVPPQVDPDAVVAAAGEGEAAPAETEMGQEIVIGDEPPATASEELVIDTGSEPAPAEETAAASETPGEVVVADVPVEPTPAPDAAAGDSDSIMAMVQDNMIPIAGGGVVLLGLLGWMVARGRKKDDGKELLAAGAAAGAATAAAPVADADITGLEEEDAEDELPDSSFLDEFSPSEMNALQDETGEVDPVSEADVYIAYGRYQQAEELLKQAMNREPERLALKHKLLEVHYATRNTAAFGALAEEMVAAGQDAVDEHAWMRAQDMGRELDPNNPLFANKGGDSAAPAAAAAGAAASASIAAVHRSESVDDDTLSLGDLDLNMSSDADQDPDITDTFEPPSEVSIMLDLDDEDDTTAVMEAPTSEIPESISLDELDDDLKFSPDKGVESVAALESGEDNITDSLDLDSMMADAEAAIDSEESMMNADSDFSADELQAQLDELSDLSVLDSGLDEPPPAGLGLVEEDKGEKPQGLDEPISLDTAFDADESSADQETDTLELDEISGPGELEGEDEVTTKLDLARAYVDMGDQDGARSILEEVVAEGNDNQRDDAEKLLAELG